MRLSAICAAAVAAATAAACGGKEPRPMTTTAPSSVSPLAADAVRGVRDPAVQALLAEHWELFLRWSPTEATTLGDHRYDDRLSPRSADAVARYRAERRALLARAAAIDPAGLDDGDRTTLLLLRGDLEAQTAADVCEDHLWAISPAQNPLNELSYLAELHRVTTPADAANLVARYRQGAQLVDDTIANLREGLRAGRVASQEVLRRVVAQLDAELAKPTSAWAMVAPAAQARPDWTDAERARFAAELHAAVADGVRPALARLRAVIADELMPKGRTGRDEGLGALPDGDACYRARIREHIGVDRTAAELHQLGLDEIARLDREIAAMGARLFGAPDLAATLTRLRTDPALYFTTGDELEAAAGAALARAQAATPRFFGVLPRAACVMARIPDYEAPFSTIAYYRQPHYDGSKPGEYFINTYKPETRPRYELEALTWHESVPGHHLQIAIAQELGDLPMYRKLTGSTAYVEGWALYTERLADEMGLYTGDLDRLGMLSYDAWRASRLVVDTGLHAMRWTRAEAEAFMRAHTALTEVNISNEVDRYIAWPGQALAYKFGQLEIFALRREAEGRLGARFSLPAFHDVVLGGGAVSLPVLRLRVEAWIADTLAQR
ncbi:MAG TPA: DUF885 domain-containing protein [Kofleriaceae bacterium]|nr:DUF885 domain-containing protein [Kofleriaceae bacterium]